MEKITIHRALAELKLVNARIEKGVKELQAVGLMQKGKLVNQTHQLEDFNKNAVSDYDSFLGLIKRRNDLKSAIVKANVETTVKIGDNEMSIADAINMKAVVVFKKLLADRLRKNISGVKTQMETVNAKVDNNALQLAAATLGRPDAKLKDNDVQAQIQPFIDANYFSYVDPIKAEEKLKALDTEIGNFEAEIDSTLSEINATTFIEVA